MLPREGGWLWLVAPNNVHSQNFVDFVKTQKKIFYNTSIINVPKADNHMSPNFQYAFKYSGENLSVVPVIIL